MMIVIVNTSVGTHPCAHTGVIFLCDIVYLSCRALFDHDAIRDDDCPSYGLSFKHGDVLHILNGSDEEWWQAALVGSYADDGPQGLIPSKKRYTMYNNHVLHIYMCYMHVSV